MSTPTSQQCFKTLFLHLNLDWKLIYFLPRILTKNTSFRASQYNVLSNVLYLNHKIFHFRVSKTSLCLYCNQHNETVQYLFSTCKQVVSLWTKTLFCKKYLANSIMSTGCNFGLLKYWWQILHNSKPACTNF